MLSSSDIAPLTHHGDLMDIYTRSDMQRTSASDEATGGQRSSPTTPPSIGFLGSGPPRWKYFKLEFVVWIIVAIVAEWIVFSPTLEYPRNSTYRALLRRFGRFDEPWSIVRQMTVAWTGGTDMAFGIDHSDYQWRQFYFNLPLLIGFMSLFVVVSQMARQIASHRGQLLTRLLLGLGFLCYLHGFSAIFVLALLLLNYAVAQLYRCVPGKVLMPAIWTLQISALVAVEQFKQSGGLERLLFEGTTYQGALRWYVVFNMSTLRMISFDYDLWEAAMSGAAARQNALDRHRDTCIDCAMHGEACYKLRSDASAQLADFNLATYFAYMLYPPLYIAGPMGSFNAFVSNMHAPQRWMSWKEWGLYCFHIARLILYMELLLHFYYFNALRLELDRDNSMIAKSMTMSDVASMSMFGLAFLWLKFSVIWKFFRAVSFADGVEVPEDMRRCFSNVGTVAEFWQSWHASFNIWIVRYMYIPLGGSRWRAISIFPIFAFIALWHDVRMRLFFWAGLMCVVMVVEQLVISFFSGPRFMWMWNGPFSRLFRTLGRLGTCTALVVANVVGFGGNGSAGVMPFGRLDVLCCVPIIFLCGCSVGVISRENDSWLRTRQVACYLPSAPPLIEKPNEGSAVVQIQPSARSESLVELSEAASLPSDGLSEEERSAEAFVAEWKASKAAKRRQ